MGFIKWLLTILAAVFGIVAIGGCFAAIWIPDGDLMNRLAATAYVSLFLGVFAGLGAGALWSAE